MITINYHCDIILQFNFTVQSFNNHSIPTYIVAPNVTVYFIHYVTAQIELW